MKRDLTRILLNVYGKPFEPETRLEVACFQALSTVFESDQRLSAEDKLKIYRLGKKVAAGGVVDFSTEELALIKERINKTFGAMPAGAVMEILDADYAEPA